MYPDSLLYAVILVLKLLNMWLHTTLILPYVSSYYYIRVLILLYIRSAVIPQLTWENFEGFHKKFYHPSNSRIYFYGDDPVPARLELIEQYLGEFDAKPQAKTDSIVGWQKKRNSPWAIEQHYPAGEDGTSLMTVNWLINDQTLTPQEELALDVMDDLLLGTPVSPLYKKLRESGLGQSISLEV